MIGFLSYLSTVAYIPHWVIMFAFLWAVIKYRVSLISSVQGFIKSNNPAVNINLILILLIIFLSLLNRILHSNQMGGARSVLPFFVLTLATYFIAIKIKRFDLKILIYLICLEGLVVMAEYFIGVSTFFTNLPRFKGFGEGDFFYFRRPLGLSENSSHIATKAFIGILLIDYLKQRSRLFLILKLILFVTIFMTFNRTILMSLIVYLFISILLNQFQGRKKVYEFLVGAIIILAGLAVVGALSINYFDEIFAKLTRDKGELDLSGRESIWSYYVSFIESHLIFGNGSYKLWFGKYHAHNSYLQLLATNGIIISILYIVLILKNIRFSAFAVILAILIYSTAQYGIFWGISLIDLVMFTFLFNQHVVELEAKEKPDLIGA
ncbi:MAG: O-antigen ligase family protein [Bacteroidetes bacterium]|nr:O-antigen ligase family protein [Bacteroidota bacterium]